MPPENDRPLATALSELTDALREDRDRRQAVDAELLVAVRALTIAIESLDTNVYTLEETIAQVAGFGGVPAEKGDSQ